MLIPDEEVVRVELLADCKALEMLAMKAAEFKAGPRIAKHKKWIKFMFSLCLVVDVNGG